MKRRFEEVERGCSRDRGGASAGGGGGAGTWYANSTAAMSWNEPGPVCGIPECNRPCFEKDGIVHGYCGRTHAREAVSRGFIDKLQPPHGRCHKCHLHGCNADVFFDGKTERVHDFCSRHHADLAMARRQWPREDSKGSTTCGLSGCMELVYRNPETGEESEYCSNRHVIAGRAEQAQQCNRAGCFRTAWIDESTGHPLDFCGSKCAVKAGVGGFEGYSRCSLPGCVQRSMADPSTGRDLGYCCEEHRLRATQRHLGPVTEPFVDRTFRGGTTSATDFHLSVLTKRHPDYLSLKEQFLQKWIKPEPTRGVSVQRIFKVEVPADIRRKTKQYQEEVKNVRRRFHGTSCSDSCNFFADLMGGPCGERACAVCNICTHGFKVEGFAGRTAQRTAFDLRYGEGLYFSSVSGKANDYASLSEKTNRKGQQVRCMFMASVAVGKPYLTYEGKLPPHLCPPRGFDSVIGEVGDNLNYDEVVVYKEEAALPTHLVVYALHN